MRTQSDSNTNGNSRNKKKHVSNWTKDKPYLEIAHKANLGNIIWFTMAVNLYNQYFSCRADESELFKAEWKITHTFNSSNNHC